MKKILFLSISYLLLTTTIFAQKEIQKFEPIDVFALEYVSDPQISPNGQQVIYKRNFKDIMTDKNLSNLWIINIDGTNHHPLTTGNHSDYSPRWSPDGKQLLYASDKDGKPQLYLRWLDNGAESKLTNLNSGVSHLAWSPDGKWIAFSMFVPEQSKPFITMPQKPKGAKWNKPARFIDKMKFQSDGVGFLKEGHHQVFILSAEGGTPRQLTKGKYNYNGNISWGSNSRALYVSSNQHSDRVYDPINSEIYKIDISDGKTKVLSNRQGPDFSPHVSPDGTKIAYLGFDDKLLGYQLNHLYIMDLDGSNSKQLLKGFDRNIENIQWAGDSKTIYFQYNSEGNTKIASTNLNGQKKEICSNVGGLSLGRPYSGGSYTVSSNNNIAFTHSTPDHPADLAVISSQSNHPKRLTRLNDDLFGYKTLGKVEEIWFNSSFDNQKIQGWICTPPGFDPNKKYPFILEIHGGPFANYGNRFSAEIQLYAAAGYVVLYTNPRGSTSYGADFGNLIHHNYPNQDFDDLMSGVDAVIKKGYIDKDQLYITGGSGGGVLTAWSVGHTKRFRAAVVAKPVINWYSFVLHSDNPNYFAKYWFPGMPWDHLEHYMKRSPISYVNKVSTPTMLLTGEEDHRTPMSETEQFYAGLKLNKVPSAMVRIPGSGHGITARPSNLITKVLHILAWFEKWKE